MDRKTWISTVATVLLIFAGCSCCLWAESIISVESESDSNGLRLVQGNFDRESCERDCQERYGAEPYRGGRSRQRNDYYLYARCIQDCNTRFWKEYDRRMRKLDKEKQ